MKTKTLLGFCAALVVGLPLFAERLEITADRIAADRASESLVASGHVVAVCHPTRLKSEYCTKDADNVSHFADPTTLTTCTNEEGHLHWSVSAEAEYADGRYVWMRNVTVRFWELPVLWVPYWRYPLDGECALRVMPGYTGRWGAYLLTKYNYHLLGDDTYGEGSWYLHGNTRFDLRWKNGIALGETLYWQLGDFGKGHFKVYYAWDRDADRYSDNWDNGRHWNYRHWSSEVPDHRYGLELEHRWEVSERDTVRIAGHLYSDSSFDSDFFRNGGFGLKNRWAGFDGNELAWEHNGNAFGAGLSVSGPLSEFIGGTSRLPEFYLDVMPTPVWKLPLDYESENRLGFLHRQAARYGDSSAVTAYSFLPGEWARYQAFRLDTYHRLTAPFKLWDVLSVVPRLAYRGTYWSESGYSDYHGWGGAGQADAWLFRSILEGGVTFAGRAVADFEGGWRHLLEPYFDVLAQEAWYAGLKDGSRPYVFDALDASMDWSDQFAGRSRNLPYSYYGVTPGVRNVISRRDEQGRYSTLLDFDLYAALQFNAADLDGHGYHSLSEPGHPNYGQHNCLVVPGFRARWFPAEDISLIGRFEYDTENDTPALSEIRWHHRVERSFSYYVSLSQRNYRWWDFSSVPYDGEIMRNEDFNRVHYNLVEVGFEWEVADALALGPYIRWDAKEHDFDAVGGWIDFRTDCLGFRFLLEYDNEYERIDGSRYDEEFSVGFYIYLRAFGPNSGLNFGD